jgi:hypothetical protein
MTFTSELIRWQQINHYTNVQVAQKLGYDHTLICKYVTRKRKVTPAVLMTVYQSLPQGDMLKEAAMKAFRGEIQL